MQPTRQETSLAGLAWQAVRRLFADEAIPLAGNIAFRALFSVFPFLIFLVTLAGFFGNEGLATQIVNFLLDVAPEKLVNTLAPEIHSILTVPRTGILSLSVLLTVWSAMGGVDSVRVALNRAYDVRDTRSFLHVYGLEVVIVIGAAVILLIVALLLVFLPVTIAAVERFSRGFTERMSIIEWFRIPLAVILLVIAVQIAHHTLPAKHMRIGEVLPGVLLTVAVWALLAVGFSYYLVNFNTFASTYASLSGLFAAMFFLYLSALVLILGGEFNRVLQLHRSRTD